jgi:hypothetical protein
MICRSGLPGGSVRRRRASAESKLLVRAKAILAQWTALHCLSVRIGQLERIAAAGVLDAEIRGARNIVEQADRLCADIDKLTHQTISQE